MKPRRKPVRRTISQRSELITDLHMFGINPDTREIVLMSSAENLEDGLDWTSANTFIKNLLLLNMMNHTPILIHQCTPGGEWEYGMAIFDAIVASPSPITLIAYAHARSMSSIIPQAARKRIITPNADFLIHFGSAGYEGDARSFVAEGKWMDKIDARMLDIYVSKCASGPFFKRNRYSREKIRTYLRNKMNEHREYYMTPTEAVDKGFMDGILGTPGFKMNELRNA